MVVARTALRTLFVSRMVGFEGVRLAAVADSEPQALERVVRARPDIVVIDMDLGARLGGLEVARNIQKVAPKTGILVMVKSLAGIDLPAESRSFGYSWSYMWQAMIDDPRSTEAVVRSVGSAVHWVDPQLKRILAKVWNIAAQTRDLERQPLRELSPEQDLSHQPAVAGSPSLAIQSVSVGDGGRGERFRNIIGVRRSL